MAKFLYLAWCAVLTLSLGLFLADAVPANDAAASEDKIAIHFPVNVKGHTIDQDFELRESEIYLGEAAISLAIKSWTRRLPSALDLSSNEIEEVDQGILFSVQKRLLGRQLLLDLELHELCAKTLNFADVTVLTEAAKAMVPLPLFGDAAKQKFVYLETGSYLGCSALLVSYFTSAQVYAHDIWVADVQSDGTSGGGGAANDEARAWQALEDNGSVPPPVVADYFFKFYQNVQMHDKEQQIVPIRGPSGYTVGIHRPCSVDLAFVDGDHSYEGATADLVAVKPKMKNGGVILVHDTEQFNADNSAYLAVRDFRALHASQLECQFAVGLTGITKISFKPEFKSARGLDDSECRNTESPRLSTDREL